MNTLLSLVSNILFKPAYKEVNVSQWREAGLCTNEMKPTRVWLNQATE